MITPKEASSALLRYFGITSFLILASCQVGVDVSVSGPATAPVFRITKSNSGGSEAADFKSLVVFAETEGGIRKIWEARASVSCANPGQVTYGSPPIEFDESGRAPRLEEGKVYQAVTMGCGASGGVSFKVAGARVEAIPSED